MDKKRYFAYNLSRLLSTGTWKPLRYWVYLCLCILLILFALSFCSPDITWVEMVGSFLDPGVFGGLSAKTQGHIGLRIALLIVSMLSIFFVASLLVSMITNTFNNVVSAYKNGDLRQSLTNHIIIIGTGEAVQGVLQQSLKESKPVVIFAPTRPNPDGDYYFYRGNKVCKEDLQTIGIESAEKIYILSDKDVPNDDISCLTCLDILKELSQSSDHKIHCYVVINEFTTSEIFCYAQNEQRIESSNLFLVDIINSHEYIAEQLMVYTDFLPVLRKKDKERFNLVILGAGNIARGVAYTVAHTCHYPNFKGKIRKTRITIMDSEAERFMDEFIAARPGLFELSSFGWVDNKGVRKTFTPKRDYQDIEWEFVALSPESQLGQQYLNQIESDDRVTIRYVVCPDNQLTIPNIMLHLPRKCYHDLMAVYSRETQSLINRANATEMYGKLIPFGFNCATFNSLLLTERAERGKRVNFIYNQAYAEKDKKANNPEEAWYNVSESDKLSSIYCALAFSLRDKCFEKTDKKAIYEAEHRRWMSTELLLGYSYSTIKDKARFLHNDICPREDLPKSERYKDKTILDAAEYILQ